MKILVLSSFYPSPEDPSFGIFIKNFYEYLGEKNGVGNTELIVMKATKSAAWKRAFEYFTFYAHILFSTLFRKYDLVYVHFLTYSSLPLRFVFLFKPLPIAINIHGSDWLTHTKLSTFLKKVSIPLYKNAKVIVVPSHYFKDLVLNELSDDITANIVVSYSGGINSNVFKPRTRIPNKKLTIGYVSHIIEKKGWRVFIDAVKKVKDDGFDIFAVMAGGGNNDDLRATIMSYNLSDIVQYNGVMTQEQLGKLYNSMDLFIFPTLYYESLGLVGVEAMACGVPVVGSNRGGLKEYINDGVNGFFFEPGDSVALALTIENYIKMPQEIKEKMSRNAVETSLKYKREVVMDHIIGKILNL